MRIHVAVGGDGYNVTIERGSIARVGDIFNLRRRVMLVTDDGVPEKYAAEVAKQCETAFIHRIHQGEKSKSLDEFGAIMSHMLECDFTRSDCVVAVGGGVVGDLAGFAAACYMRGVDFVNVPTTLLSQVDSSIGGKTAVNLDGIKNIVGAFYQPRAVIIDPNTLDTLPNAQVANGLAEAVKMSLTSDSELFGIFESGMYLDDMENVIARSLLIKKAVVEADEREKGLRRILNFGHTIGHGIESVSGELYHGQCVALGMLPMCDVPVRERLRKVLVGMGLPVECQLNAQKVYEAVLHDKKASAEGITVVRVASPGEYSIELMPPEELYGAVCMAVKGDMKA